jgi:glycosyltransferase involved in cell wall biosynthesis
MKKILIDCTCLRDQPSGVGFYTYQLIKALDKIQVDDHFVFGIYCQPSMKKWLTRNFTFPQLLQDHPNSYLLPIPVTISNLLAKYYPSFLNQFNSYLPEPYLIHGTDHYVYPYPKSYKVMTIMDLTFIKYPFYSNSIVKTYIDRLKQCLKWTDLVLTISESSKQDIMEYLGVKPEKIVVTYLASRYTNYSLSDDQKSKLQSSISYNFNIPYILFVSTLEPRKNVVNLIKSFNLLKHEYKIPHNLVLIGQKGWYYQEIFSEINNSPFKENIYHLGYLSDELVALFYSLADVFVYPSFYEGFGLPVLEAMTLGSPVVTSHTSSLPEVAGDSAIYVNPQEVSSISEGIYQVINNPQLRQDLIAKGRERAKLFSWGKMAQETINAYKL